MMIYPNSLASIFKIGWLTTNHYAITLEFAGDAIAIREMDAGSSFFHRTIDVLPRSANKMRMKWIAHFYR